MVELISTKSVGEDGAVATHPFSPSVQKLADSVREAWSQGEAPDLVRLLEENSELRSQRSLVIDLAVDQYHVMRRRGHLSDINQYCDPFAPLGGALHSSIYRQIEVERYLDDHPELRLIEQQIEWPAIGDTIAGFHVLEEVGRGALARVYLCSQYDLGDRQVVVKVSRRGTQEGSTLGKLRHPHIMPVHSIDIHDDGGLCYLCTPFLGRSTLVDLIDIAFSSDETKTARTILDAANVWSISSDRFTEGPHADGHWHQRSYVDGVLHLAIHLTDALAHAHSAGVLHGDLKPSNILLTPDGKPVLLDFNLARDDALALDIRGGTLPYMAPEQISQLLLKDDTRRTVCDERSEVFSLGVVLYELLSGQLPFKIDKDSSDATDLPAQMLRRQQIGPPSLLKCSATVDQSLASKIEQCLENKPEARFASMKELRVALVGELTPQRRASRWIRIHRSGVERLLLATIIVGVGCGWWLASRPPYHVRQYRHGLSYQAAGQMQQAHGYFERAASADPSFIDARFGSARANLAMGNIDQALDQFVRLAQKHGHAASMACVGYCFNLEKHHSVAMPWYQRALDAGFESAGLHNNLAVCYLLSRTKLTLTDQHELAQMHLAKASEISPLSLSVHLNFAHLDARRAMKDSAYVPEDGVRHLKFLLDNEVDDPKVYVLAIQLYAAMARRDPSCLDQKMNLLIDACERNVGVDIAPIYLKSHLQVFREHPLFPSLESAANKQSRRASALSISRFINPIDLGRIRISRRD